MTSPNISKNPQTATSPGTMSAGVGSSPQAIDLTGAKLSSLTGDSTVSLTALSKATELLWPGELRAQLIERMADVRGGRLRAPSEPTNTDAFVAVYGMSDESREQALRKFLTSHAQHPWPVAGYSQIGCSSPEEKQLYPDRSLANSLSLLERGVLPIEEVAPHIRALGLSLRDTSFDKIKTYLPIAAGTAVACVGALAPLWATVASGLAGVATCAWFSKRLSLRNEYAAGLQMESLDAYRTISHGEVFPIGVSLNGLFNDPRIADNYGNLLRADAFLIARTLRVFGMSTDEIYAAFRDSTTSYSAGELLIEKVIRSLEAHGVTAPSMLVIPFVEGPMNEGRDNEARDLIEVMNQVHFEWAIHEKGAVRKSFAAAILNAKD